MLVDTLDMADHKGMMPGMCIILKWSFFFEVVGYVIHGSVTGPLHPRTKCRALSRAGFGESAPVPSLFTAK